MTKQQATEVLKDQRAQLATWQERRSFLDRRIAETEEFIKKLEGIVADATPTTGV